MKSDASCPKHQSSNASNAIELMHPMIMILFLHHIRNECGQNEERHLLAAEDK